MWWSTLHHLACVSPADHKEVDHHMRLVPEVQDSVDHSIWQRWKEMPTCTQIHTLHHLKRRIYEYTFTEIPHIWCTSLCWNGLDAATEVGILKVKVGYLPKSIEECLSSVF